MRPVGDDIDHGSDRTFPRSMRLKKRRLIGALFDRSSGQTNSVRSGSVRLVYRLAERHLTGTESPVQVGFAVGKIVGNAAQRNRMKRIARETWRLNRSLIPDETIPADQVLTVMLVYRPSHPPGSESTLRSDVELSMERLAAKLMTELPRREQTEP